MIIIFGSTREVQTIFLYNLTADVKKKTFWLQNLRDSCIVLQVLNPRLLSNNFFSENLSLRSKNVLYRLENAALVAGKRLQSPAELGGGVGRGRSLLMYSIPCRPTGSPFVLF